jgi:hypothetical protein
MERRFIERQERGKREDRKRGGWIEEAEKCRKEGGSLLYISRSALTSLQTKSPRLLPE